MGFLNNAKLIVGYDLGNKDSQISYSLSETGESETISQIAGEQKYNIPTVLCKKYGVNQWLYGREALRVADRQEGILVENLLDMALDGEPVVVDGESYDPVALLTLFFRRSLGQLSQTGTKIWALMVTCPVIDRRVLEVLGYVVKGAELKTERIAFQSHEESFYSYMLCQPGELWNHPAVLLDYRDGDIRVYLLESNKRTTPVVVYIEEKAYPFFGERELTPEVQEEMDAGFMKIAEEVCGRSIIGSIFLIGDGFQGDWMKDSLRFLCRGRRVFQGNNLFSKGACRGMQEKISPSEAGKAHVFLGREKLKSNIGMKILRNGEESYYALLDAGINWYEAERSLEVYIQEGNEIMLNVTPLAGAPGRKKPGGEGSLVRIVLEGLPEGTARLKLHFFLKTEGVLAVEAEDLGFGEFRAPSGRSWQDEIEL